MKNNILRMIILSCLLIVAAGTTFLADQQMVLAPDQSKFPATIIIHVDGEIIKRLTYQEILLDAVDEAGIAVGENDQLSLPDDTPLQPGQTYEVAISRLNRVTLSWNGYSVGTAGDFASMSELISRSGYSGLDLSDGSRVENSQPSELADGNIYLTYVSVDVRIVRTYEDIPHSSITIDDDTLYKGQTKTKTKGQDGQRALIFEETYENGIFIKTEQVGTEIVKEPVQQVIRKGTKERYVFYPFSRKTVTQTVLASLSKISDKIMRNGTKCYESFTDNGDGTITVDGTTYAYSSMKKRTATMYDGLEVCLQKSCHNPPVNHGSASGVASQRGMVAVAAKIIDGKVATALPMGTIIFVEGYGLGVVGDINGAKTNPDLIDVCYDGGDIRAGIAAFGKRYPRVYILKMP